MVAKMHPYAVEDMDTVLFKLEQLKNDNYQIFRQLESKLNNLQNNISKLQRMNALYKRAELFNLHLPSTIVGEIPEIEIDFELKESLATEIIDQASKIQSEKSKFSVERLCCTKI